MWQDAISEPEWAGFSEAYGNVVRWFNDEASTIANVELQQAGRNGIGLLSFLGME